MVGISLSVSLGSAFSTDAGGAPPVSITATITPATSVLTVGDALEDTTNWATFLLTSNYSTDAGGETIDTVTVNYIGDTPDATTALILGDENHFSITVEDTGGNSETFETTLRVVADLPTIAGASGSPNALPGDTLTGSPTGGTWTADGVSIDAGVDGDELFVFEEYSGTDITYTQGGQDSAALTVDPFPYTTVSSALIDTAESTNNVSSLSLDLGAVTGTKTYLVSLATQADTFFGGLLLDGVSPTSEFGVIEGAGFDNLLHAFFTLDVGVGGAKTLSWSISGTGYRCAASIFEISDYEEPSTLELEGLQATPVDVETFPGSSLITSSGGRQAYPQPNGDDTFIPPIVPPAFHTGNLEDDFFYGSYLTPGGDQNESYTLKVANSLDENPTRENILATMLTGTWTGEPKIDEDFDILNDGDIRLETGTGVYPDVFDASQLFTNEYGGEYSLAGLDTDVSGYMSIDAATGMISVDTDYGSALFNYTKVNVRCRKPFGDAVQSIEFTIHDGRFGDEYLYTGGASGSGLYIPEPDGTPTNLPNMWNATDADGYFSVADVIFNADTTGGNILSWAQKTASNKYYNMNAAGRVTYRNGSSTYYNQPANYHPGVTPGEIYTVVTHVYLDSGPKVAARSWMFDKDMVLISELPETRLKASGTGTSLNGTGGMTTWIDRRCGLNTNHGTGSGTFDGRTANVRTGTGSPEGFVDDAIANQTMVQDYDFDADPGVLSVEMSEELTRTPATGVSEVFPATDFNSPDWLVAGTIVWDAFDNPDPAFEVRAEPPMLSPMNTFYTADGLSVKPKVEKGIVGDKDYTTDFGGAYDTLTIGGVDATGDVDASGYIGGSKTGEILGTVTYNETSYPISGWRFAELPVITDSPYADLHGGWGAVCMIPAYVSPGAGTSYGTLAALQAAVNAWAVEPVTSDLIIADCDFRTGTTYLNIPSVEYGGYGIKAENADGVQLYGLDVNSAQDLVVAGMRLDRVSGGGCDGLVIEDCGLGSTYLDDGTQNASIKIDKCRTIRKLNGITSQFNMKFYKRVELYRTMIAHINDSDSFRTSSNQDGDWSEFVLHRTLVFNNMETGSNAHPDLWQNYLGLCSPTVYKCALIDRKAPAGVVDSIVLSQALNLSGGLATGVNGDLATHLQSPRKVVGTWTGAATVTVHGEDFEGTVITEDLTTSGTEGVTEFWKVTDVTTTADVTDFTLGTVDEGHKGAQGMFIADCQTIHAHIEQTVIDRSLNSKAITMNGSQLNNCLNNNTLIGSFDQGAPYGARIGGVAIDNMIVNETSPAWSDDTSSPQTNIHDYNDDPTNEMSSYTGVKADWAEYTPDTTGRGAYDLIDDLEAATA